VVSFGPPKRAAAGRGGTRVHGIPWSKGQVRSSEERRRGRKRSSRGVRRTKVEGGRLLEKRPRTRGRGRDVAVAEEVDGDAMVMELGQEGGHTQQTDRPLTDPHTTDMTDQPRTHPPTTN